MTLPSSDAHPSRILPQRPQMQPPTHSMPVSSSQVPSPQPGLTPSSLPAIGLSEKLEHERAIDVASQSWDLATGGLKTLTAKRELPPLLERRRSERLPDAAQVRRNYTFVLIILACIVLMLIGGGVALLVVLQP